MRIPAVTAAYEAAGQIPAVLAATLVTTSAWAGDAASSGSEVANSNTGVLKLFGDVCELAITNPIPTIAIGAGVGIAVLGGVYFGVVKPKLRDAQSAIRGAAFLLGEARGLEQKAGIRRSEMATSGQIEVIQGNITEQSVDAIVNAANSDLAGGGGVDGAIHSAAGWDELQALCKPLGGCPTGSAKMTGSCGLAERGIKHIIHAVGPIYGRNAGRDDELLAGCYRESLRLAEESGDIESIAFPAISTGVYGFPAALAAKIAAREIKAFLATSQNVKRVVLVGYSSDSTRVLAKGVRKAR